MVSPPALWYLCPLHGQEVQVAEKCSQLESQSPGCHTWDSWNPRRPSPDSLRFAPSIIEAPFQCPCSLTEQAAEDRAETLVFMHFRDQVFSLQLFLLPSSLKLWAYVVQFCVNLTQARIIREEASVEKMPP